MLDFNELPIGMVYYSVSEEVWFAVGVDDDGEIDGDRDFGPIADCVTFADAQQAAVEAVGVRGRSTSTRWSVVNGALWGLRSSPVTDPSFGASSEFRSRREYGRPVPVKA